MACIGKSTSDPIVGEFVFNYILNMLNTQRDFSKITSIDEMQDKLLTGNTFNDIDHIQEEGVLDLYDVLAKGNVQGAIYGKGVSIPSKQKKL